MKQTKQHQWTNEELKLLMEMWQAETPLSDIASRLNLTHHAVSKMVVRLRQNGVPLRRRNRGCVAGRIGKLWTQAEVEYVYRRRGERATVETIAIELGRTWNAVNAMIARLRGESVDVPMLGHGVRKLWDADVLKGVMAQEGANVVQMPVRQVA